MANERPGTAKRREARRGAPSRGICVCGLFLHFDHNYVPPQNAELIVGLQALFDASPKS